MPAVLLRIHGRVQGVGYRAWTVGQAKKRGLNGWVRNRTDGTVEALISGPENIVSEMIEACRKGPLIARVNKIEEMPTSEAEPGFSALPSI
jgi:acylphosphatase